MRRVLEATRRRCVLVRDWCTPACKTLRVLPTFGLSENELPSAALSNALSWLTGGFIDHVGSCGHKIGWLRPGGALRARKSTFVSAHRSKRSPLVTVVYVMINKFSGKVAHAPPKK